MIILIGISGSGKTLQGGLLSSRLGYDALSMGQLLRDNGSPEIQKKLEQGVWLTQDQIGSVLLDELGKYNMNSVVLDGFPRTLGQTEWLVGQCKEGLISVSAVYVLDATMDVVIARMKDRGRSDDTPDAMQRRFNNYIAEINGVLRLLKSSGIYIEHIDADKDAETVYAAICSSIKNLEIIINDN